MYIPPIRPFERQNASSDTTGDTGLGCRLSLVYFDATTPFVLRKQDDEHILMAVLRTWHNV